ncbi:unnamed protein product [Pleuronectes platessa]|uniref:Uncharacterized protein n=1 Tax=Pleuronectes platessa TaxID=8262 RepID=A0A9N7YQ63_PLEPL|nr:unnamed protein product [Pleuronectes platessa]
MTPSCVPSHWHKSKLFATNCSKSLPTASCLLWQAPLGDCENSGGVSSCVTPRLDEDTWEGVRFTTWGLGISSRNVPECWQRFVSPLGFARCRRERKTTKPRSRGGRGMNKREGVGLENPAELGEHVSNTFLQHDGIFSQLVQLRSGDSVVVVSVPLEERDPPCSIEPVGGGGGGGGGGGEGGGGSAVMYRHPPSLSRYQAAHGQ